MENLIKAVEVYENIIDDVWHFIWWNYLPSFMPFLICYSIFVGGVTGGWSFVGAMISHILCTVIAGIILVMIEYNDLYYYEKWSGVHTVYKTLENHTEEKGSNAFAERFAIMFAWFSLFEIALWTICGVIYVLFMMVIHLALILLALLSPLWRYR